MALKLAPEAVRTIRSVASRGMANRAIAQLSPCAGAASEVFQPLSHCSRSINASHSSSGYASDLA